MKSYTLKFWRKAKAPHTTPRLLGDTVVRDVPDTTRETELCGHYEGFANIFLRGELGPVDFVTCEELP